jgi:malonyl-CoA/methylmalonyl-CoA synthetase
MEQLEQVEKASVFGVPHPDYGEAVVAAVQLKPGSTAETTALLAALKEKLAGYKVPKALFAVEQFPLTELGKVQRSALVKQYAQHFSNPAGKANLPRR